MSGSTCFGCIWFDQCGSEERCDGYDPAVDDEKEKQEIKEYKRDLKKRHRLYSRQVREQNS